MIHILVAMNREREALGLPFEVINISGTSIPPIAPSDTIVNVGYCGGDGFKPGTVIEPTVSIDAETGERINLTPHFSAKTGSSVTTAICVTSPSFVTQPLIESPAVYDMELAKLARIPCKALYCLKIVSDELNEADCEGFHSDAAWSTIRRLLASTGLIQLSLTQPKQR